LALRTFPSDSHLTPAYSKGVKHGTFLGGNGYQMKSTAIFLGVNVAASIPLVFCQQANAAEGETQLSGTADFLKTSLGKTSDKAVAKAMMAGNPTFTAARRPLRIRRDLTATETLSNPRAIAARTTLAPINGVPLRPFVVGRKLPSKADLDSGFNAMAPQFDRGSDPSNLTANVSENNYTARQASQEYANPGYGDYRPADLRAQNRTRLKDAARVASGYDRRSASRSIPNQSPSTPGQVGFPCAQQAVANMQPVRSGNPNDWGQMAADIKAQGFDQAMQTEAQKLAATNGPEQTEQPGHTAGPAPFPLSLLPEASLKQFIGGTSAAAKRPQNGAPSYFGSWKAGQPIASKPALQPSGFHTYLGSGSGGNSGGNSHMLASSAFKNYAPMAMSSRRAMPSRPGESAPAKHIAQNVQASSSVHVATYGPYVSHVAF
jgi:hypothetical protein